MHKNENILNLISPKVTGIVWLTKNKLSTDLNLFDKFNYLFDGLLSEYISTSESQNLLKFQSFYTKNFGKKLWLLHLSGDILSSEIDETITLLNSNQNPDELVLILNECEKKWEAELPKRYPHIQFIS